MLSHSNRDLRLQDIMFENQERQSKRDNDL